MSLNTKQERSFLNSALFSGCDIKKYRSLTQSLSPVSIPKGKLISSFTPASQIPSLCFILDGSIDVYNTNGVLFATLEKGDFFEPTSMFSHITPILPMQIRARTNTVVTFLDKDRFLPVFHTDPPLAHNYTKIISDNLQLLVQRLQHFTAATPGVALALYLLGNHTQNSLRLPDGLAGLSRRLNVSRATLYRALGDLEQQKLVSHRDKTIRILNSDGLKQYVAIYSQSTSILSNE